MTKAAAALAKDGSEASHQRTQSALDSLWPYTAEWFGDDTVDRQAEAAGIGLWSTELEGELPRWNRRLYELFGLSPAEPPLSMGPWLQRCVHPEDRDRIAALLLEWARNGTQAIELEFRTLRVNDGAVRWLVLRGDIDRRSADDRHRVEGVIIDLTEQRETTRQLHEAAERVALAASAVGLGSWRLERPGAVSHWDEGMFRLRGLPPQSRAVNFQEMLGYLHPDDRPWALGEQSVRRPASEVWRHSFRVVWPDGSVRWLASVSSRRSRKVPCACRASRKLKSAVRILPRCSRPVGLGAKRVLKGR